jgi:hypothetical protein
MSERIVIDVDRDGWTKGLQLNIAQLDENDKGWGYRLHGPKYNGSSKNLARHVLDERDAAEIRKMLDAAFPLADAGESEPATPAAPRTERSYWQAIADTITAAGMPVGIDLDGTLTDHQAWSVVWDRQAEQWAVAGYDDESTQCPAAYPGDASPCEGPADAVRIVDHRTTSAEALANPELGTHGCVHHGARLLASTGGGRVYPGPSDATGRKPGQSASVETYLRANGGTS